MPEFLSLGKKIFCCQSLFETIVLRNPIETSQEEEDRKVLTSGLGRNGNTFGKCPITEH